MSRSSSRLLPGCRPRHAETATALAAAGIGVVGVPYADDIVEKVRSTLLGVGRQGMRRLGRQWRGVSKALLKGGAFSI